MKQTKNTEINFTAIVPNLGGTRKLNENNVAMFTCSMDMPYDENGDDIHISTLFPQHMQSFLTRYGWTVKRTPIFMVVSKSPSDALACVEALDDGGAAEYFWAAAATSGDKPQRINPEHWEGAVNPYAKIPTIEQQNWWSIDRAYLAMGRHFGCAIVRCPSRIVGPYTAETFHHNKTALANIGITLGHKIGGYWNPTDDDAPCAANALTDVDRKRHALNFARESTDVLGNAGRLNKLNIPTSLSTTLAHWAQNVVALEKRYDAALADVEHPFSTDCPTCIADAVSNAKWEADFELQKSESRKRAEIQRFLKTTTPKEITVGSRRMITGSACVGIVWDDGDSDAGVPIDSAEFRIPASAALFVSEFCKHVGEDGFGFEIRESDATVDEQNEWDLIIRWAGDDYALPRISDASVSAAPYKVDSAWLIDVEATNNVLAKIDMELSVLFY